MARVTVEDCVDKVSNRFDLVMRAAHRARSISDGASITVARDNDKTSEDVGNVEEEIQKQPST